MLERYAGYSGCARICRNYDVRKRSMGETDSEGIRGIRRFARRKKQGKRLVFENTGVSAEKGSGISFWEVAPSRRLAGTMCDVRVRLFFVGFTSEFIPCTVVWTGWLVSAGGIALFPESSGQRENVAGDKTDLQWA